VSSPEAAALFYGSMALVAGLQRNRGCEITAVANALHGRDDQIGCPLFAPFDQLDAHARTAPAALPSNDRTRDPSSGLRARV
jgi:hypothetical protein